MPGRLSWLTYKCDSCGYSYADQNTQAVEEVNWHAYNVLRALPSYTFEGTNQTVNTKGGIHRCNDHQVGGFSVSGILYLLENEQAPSNISSIDSALAAANALRDKMGQTEMKVKALAGGAP